jgi:hypothetical protein
MKFADTWVGVGLCAAALGCGGGGGPEGAGSAWGDAAAAPTVVCQQLPDFGIQVHCGSPQEYPPAMLMNRDGGWTTIPNTEISESISFGCEGPAGTPCSSTCDAARVPQAPCPSGEHCIITVVRTTGTSVGYGSCP